MTTASPVSPDSLWSPMVQYGAEWCAANIHAKCRWLDVSGARWRVSLTTATPRNSYVVSATGQYLDYAAEETRRLPSPVTREVSRIGLAALAPLLRRLDPIVVLDALPVSTVLHAPRSAAEWNVALAAARDEFRGAPIIVRSLDQVHAATTIDHLRAAGLCLMASRLVFHQDPRGNAFWKIRNIKHDMAMASSAPMHHRELVPADSGEIASLYWQLYGDKHSTLNPRFSAEWLAHAMRTGVFAGEGLVHDGRLVAVYLAYRVEDVMTNPVFGYDTSLPQELGLYRRLSLLSMQRAHDTGARLHASSGAPGFKQSRGGVPVLEYHAVDLSTVRGVARAAWATAIRVADSVGPAMLRQAQ